jgi:hypothetical protein
MNYAMSPSSKRMMASNQRMSRPSNSGTNFANNQAIPTPSHVARTQQTPKSSNMNYSGQNYASSGQNYSSSSQNNSGQYAQQANQPSKYRVARRPQQSQQNSQQMMYQQ